MTTQILLDAVTKAYINWGQIALLILDECHHAQKNHPMAEVRHVHTSLHITLYKVGIALVQKQKLCIFVNNITEKKSSLIGLFKYLLTFTLIEKELQQALDAQDEHVKRRRLNSHEEIVHTERKGFNL